MYDYLAITKRTELGSPVREVAINLLTTLRGDEAVDAATRTIDGVSAELS